MSAQTPGLFLQPIDAFWFPGKSVGSRDVQYAAPKAIVSLACEKEESRKELTGTAPEVPEPLVPSKLLGRGDLVSWLFPWP